MSSQGIKEPAGRVGEAVLIAVLSSLFERLYDHLRERHDQRAATDARIVALETEIVMLKAKVE